MSNAGQSPFASGCSFGIGIVAGIFFCFVGLPCILFTWLYVLMPRDAPPREPGPVDGQPHDRVMVTPFAEKDPLPDPPDEPSRPTSPPFREPTPPLPAPATAPVPLPEPEKPFRSQLDSILEEKARKEDQAKKDASKKAATLMRTAANLEKLGKSQAALDYYRKVVNDFRGTEEAKAAAAKVEELENN